MRIFVFFVVRTIAAGLLITSTALAGGLSCSLGEVVVDNLQIGSVYDLTELANTRIIVTNTGDITVKLRMDVLVPEASELKLNSEPIPDASWIRLSQTEFEIAPSANAESHIQLTIPDDERLLGRRFQVTIWSHTVPSEETGLFLACGLKSRLIFTTDSVRHTAPDYVGNSATRLRLTPAEIHWNSAHADTRTMTVINEGETAQVVHLKAQAMHDSYTSLPAGYEDCSDPAMVWFSEDTVTLPPHGSRTVDVRLTLSDLGRNGMGDCMLIIVAESGGETVQSRVYSRVYLTLN